MFRSRLLKMFFLGALIAVPIFCPVAPVGAVAEEGLFLPKTDRRTGEEFFVTAYRAMAEGHYAGALEWLEKAIDRDPYLIEYYLLRGYCLSHLGDVEGTLESLRLYLDVRKNDPLADGLKRQIERASFVLERYLAAGNSVEPRVGPVCPLDESLELRALSLRGMTMPGQPFVGQGYMTLCDTGRGRIRIYRREAGRWGRVFAGRTGPAVKAFPMEKDLFVVFFADGTMSHAEWKGGKLEFSPVRRVTEGRIADADLASSAVAVVADRILRKVLFVDCTNGEILSRWDPGYEGFEPVSVAALGTQIAVADRCGDKVRVFDAFSGDLLRVHDMKGVRAVAWLNSAQVLAVSEEGKLDLIPMGGVSRTLLKAFPEAWFLFRDGRNGVVLTDTRLYRSVRVRSGFDKGFLTLKEPVFLDLEGDMPMLSVKGAVLHPFRSEDESEDEAKAPVFRGVWGGELLDVKAVPLHPGKVSRVVRVPSEEYPTVKAGEELPYGAEVLLVDLEACRNEGVPTRWQTLGTLALMNGIPVYLLVGEEIPTMEEVRLAELTGGDVLFRDEGAVHLSPARFWELYLQASPGIALPGDPEDGGLYVRGNLEKLEMDDRLPIWTALLPVEVLEGVTSTDLYGVTQEPE